MVTDAGKWTASGNTPKEDKEERKAYRWAEWDNDNIYWVVYEWPADKDEFSYDDDSFMYSSGLTAREAEELVGYTILKSEEQYAVDEQEVMAAYLKREAAASDGEDDPLDWKFDIRCNTCSSEDIECYVCLSVPEQCMCIEDPELPGVWCLDCDQLRLPVGDDVERVSTGGFRYKQDALDAFDDAYKKFAIKDSDDDEVEVKCYCEPQVSNYCEACSVFRLKEATHTTQGGDWEAFTPKDDPEDHMGKKRRKKQKQKQKNRGKGKSGGALQSGGKKFKSYSSYDYSDWGWSSDRHYGEPVQIGAITVYASSSWNSRKHNDFVPDWGLYADWCWRPAWRAEHISWPDMSIPDDDSIAFEQILVAVEKAQAGQKVEVGCIGGHGRTGTILATMGVILGMTAEEAIDHVRTSYCTHAIETATQEWWVEMIYAVLNGKDVPTKPKWSGYGKGSVTSYTHNSNTGGYSGKASTVGGGTTSGGVVSGCSQKAHYDAWLMGATTCPTKGASCSWWDETDVPKFEAGNVSNAVLHERSTPKRATSTIVKGYIVPKPGKNQRLHSAGARKGCKCDVCRYLDRGHGVFLRPSDTEEGIKWDAMMNNLLTETVDGVNARQRAIQKDKQAALKAALKEKHGEQQQLDLGSDDIDKNIVKISCPPNGDAVVETKVSDTWEPKPPILPPVKPGEVRGEYVYHPVHGWVWERLAKLDFDALTN